VELAARLREMGVCVITPAAGDVAGAMFALLPGTGVDMLMGIGGTPEGIMAACAVKVIGGGVTGQAGAVRHGLARALVQADANFRPTLKKAGLLARDARVKERKKAGLKRARKAPQYSKR